MLIENPICSLFCCTGHRVDANTFKFSHHIITTLPNVCLSPGALAHAAPTIAPNLFNFTVRICCEYACVVESRFRSISAAQPPLGMMFFFSFSPTLTPRTERTQRTNFNPRGAILWQPCRIGFHCALVLVPCIVRSRARGRVELDTNLTRRRCEMSYAPPSRPSLLRPAPLLVAQILPTPHSCSNRRRRVRRAVQLAGLAALANMH